MKRYVDNKLFDEKVGVTVVLRESETADSLIKRFKKKVHKSEILREYKNKMEYFKPSIAKRKKSADARRRDERDLLKMERMMEKKHKKTKKDRKRNNNIDNIVN